MKHRFDSIIQSPTDKDKLRIVITCEPSGFIDKILGRKKKSITYEGIGTIWRVWPDGDRAGTKLEHILDSFEHRAKTYGYHPFRGKRKYEYSKRLDGFKIGQEVSIAGLKAVVYVVEKGYKVYPSCVLTDLSVDLPYSLVEDKLHLKYVDKSGNIVLKTLTGNEINALD